ncbi:MAG TPA: hypothetical protein VK932_05035, partial [Kofleriaceae bacterium]|nr:hypothetical protein [Kofleriaceae bacterium]
NEVDTVDSKPLLITASAGTGAVVVLAHDLFTGLGNVAITETVSDPDFAVTGMSGGAGGDCSAGETCAIDEDCESNVCMMNVCQAPAAP